MNDGAWSSDSFLVRFGVVTSFSVCFPSASHKITYSHVTTKQHELNGPRRLTIFVVYCSIVH